MASVTSLYILSRRASLDEICRLMGMPGKPEGFCGSDVESYFREGRIQEIAAYCEGDVVNTYRLWLRHELFRGRLDRSKYEESELRLSEFLDCPKFRVSSHLFGWRLRTRVSSFLTESEED